MTEFILKSTLCLALFYIVYKLLFEYENMHIFKRFYLLSGLFFSLVVPFISFEINPINATAPISKSIQTVILPVLEMKGPSNHFPTLIYIIYGVTTTVLLFRFLIHLYQLYRQFKSATLIMHNNAKIALVEDQIVPHTFWTTIFMNKNDYHNHNIEPEIFTHELAHVRQRHTIDILFIELLKTIFWFNPLFILYKKAIQLNHEFLADETVIASHQDVPMYQQLLLSRSYSQFNLHLASNLNSFLKTKKRFIMMTKDTSTTIQSLKKAIVVPLFLAMFFFGSSITFAQTTPKTKSKSEDKAVVSKEKDQNADVYTEVEKKPDFPGGIKAFYEFVGKNYKVPNVKNLNGKIFIQFVVEKDGSLSDIKVIRDIGHGTGDEAVRVLKLSPNWTPGEQNGKPVRVQYALPISLQSRN
jgi:hypothetical protein